MQLPSIDATTEVYFTYQMEFLDTDTFSLLLLSVCCSYCPGRCCWLLPEAFQNRLLYTGTPSVSCRGEANGGLRPKAEYRLNQLNSLFWHKWDIQ